MNVVMLLHFILKNLKPPDKRSESKGTGLYQLHNESMTPLPRVGV